MYSRVRILVERNKKELVLIDMIANNCQLSEEEYSKNKEHDNGKRKNEHSKDTPARSWSATTS